MELVPAVNLKSRLTILMFLPMSSVRTALEQLAVACERIARSVRASFVKQSSYLIYKVLIKSQSSCGGLCR